MLHENGGCRSVLTMLFVASQAAATSQFQQHQYKVGDEILSKISYTSKKGKGHVVTGEHGKFLRLETTSSKIYATCDFPNFPSAKLLIGDVALVGDMVLDGWRVGHQVISGVEIDDGQYGYLNKGDPGVVLGRWNQTHIHLKFETMRRKSVLRPKFIHLKMVSRPAEVLVTLCTSLLVGVPALWYLWKCLSGGLHSLRKLPGGYLECDQVISLHEEERLGLKIGDVGVVAGKSHVDRDKRITVCFGFQRINVLLCQIAKKGEYTLGSYHVGDAVVANILDGTVSCTNGQTLKHGTKGVVLNKSTSMQRVLCYFEGGITANVLLPEITHKKEYMNTMKSCKRASANVKKDQRELQKEVLRTRQVQQQVEPALVSAGTAVRAAIEDQSHGAMESRWTSNLAAILCPLAQSNAKLCNMLDAFGWTGTQFRTPPNLNDLLSVLEVQQQVVDDDEEVEDPFLCPMCYHLLLGPVTLVCGHTLCKGCVESWKAACGQPFKSPCCNRVVPYELKERKSMSKDIEKLYPKQLARRFQEFAENVAEESQEAVVTASTTFSPTGL